MHELSNGRQVPGEFPNDGRRLAHLRAQQTHACSFDEVNRPTVSSSELHTALKLEENTEELQAEMTNRWRCCILPATVLVCA